jgi:predicted nucleic acid-binding protein
MIRVVLDTNILISALLSPLGPPAQVFLAHRLLQRII